MEFIFIKMIRRCRRCNDIFKTQHRYAKVCVNCVKFSYRNNKAVRTFILQGIKV